MKPFLLSKSSSIYTFRRLKFNLSSENPIHVIHNTHHKTGGMFFDAHYELEVGCIMKGTMQRVYEGWQSEMKAGEIWLCGIWEPHGFRIVSAPCEVLVIVVLPEMLAFGGDSLLDWLAPFGAAPSLRPRVDGSKRLQILRIAKQIISASEKTGPQRSAWLRVLLQQLLLIHRENWISPPRNARLNTCLYNRIEPSIKLVFESKKYITVAQAALACGMSRNAFASLFKHISGISFSEFALRYRLNAIAYALETSDTPPKALAKEWGFADASHLHKCFKHYTGLSPAQYRFERQHGRLKDICEVGY